MAFKPSSVLTGVAGVHLVAAELSRRGFIASITLRNTRGIDILASNPDASRQVAIQVKTAWKTNGKWLMDRKAESYFADGLFYVFVDLTGESRRSKFYIVPSKIVADHVKMGHRKWLRTRGKRGQKRKDSPMRTFKDREGKFLERWDSIGL
jgi:hypothetical protein